MFSEFSASSERERDRVAFRRLCTLRVARRAGYFDEAPAERGEWPDESEFAPLAGDNVSDGEFDAWLREQPGLGEVIDRLKAAGAWDYESDEGFRGRKV